MKTHRMSFVGFLLALGLAGAARAQTALSAVETSPIRTGPGTGYGEIGRVAAGTGTVGVELVRSSAGDLWWKIYFDGRKAFARADHWKTVADAGGVKIVRDETIVRTGPGSTYAVAGRSWRGRIYRRVAVSNGWFNIWYGGKLRWVWSGAADKTRLFGVSGPANSTSAEIDMSPYWKKQETNYWCGPATLQMMVRYMKGLYYRQSYLAGWLGTTRSGTNTNRENAGLERFTGRNFTFRAYKRSMILDNIRRSAPPVIRFTLRYVSYDGGSSSNHFSAVRGYTPDGYYIADVFYGPRKWATTTQLYNATHYISYPGWSFQVRYPD